MPDGYWEKIGRPWMAGKQGVRIGRILAPLKHYHQFDIK
jgi:hypothetical protein